MLRKLGYILWVTIILCFGIQQSFSQTGDAIKLKPRQQAASNVIDLKKGTLIIRLKSDAEKISHLRMKGLKTDAKRLEQNWHDFNIAFVQSLSAYDYSDVAITYGHLLKEHGPFSQIYLNENLEPDSTKIIKEGPVFYIFVKGKGGEIDICDENFAILSGPKRHSDIHVDDLYDSRYEKYIFNSRNKEKRAKVLDKMRELKIGEKLNHQFSRSHYRLITRRGYIKQ